MDNVKELTTELKKLGIAKNLVIAHASLRSLGSVKAETLLEAILESTRGIVMPTFTYKSMLNPEIGPPSNGMTYGNEKDLNKLAEQFHADMPVDTTMGILPEVLRKHPQAKRSSHPIQSFAGIGADGAINSQSVFEPFAPIAALAEQDAWILLLGVDHQVNTSIHYGEKLAGRMQFIRWALTKDKVVECPGFPGDSEGFNAIAPEVEKHTRRVEINGGLVQAVHLRSLLKVTVEMIHSNPYALLCGRPDCERCEAVRYG